MNSSNPKLYRELSKPFDNQAAARQAINNFVDDLEKLREKHKICDLVTVIHVNVMSEESEEGVMAVTIGFGDMLKRPMMLAQALGKEQKAVEQIVSRYLKS